MISQDSIEERRITLRLLAYWEKRRQGRPMPREEDIDPADIADLWPYCFLAHTRDIGKPGYCFTYLGKAIRDLYEEGMEQSGEGPHFPDMDGLATGYHHVLQTQKPLVTEGELIIPHGDHFKYRQVLLPLGNNGELHAVFGGMRFLRVLNY